MTFSISLLNKYAASGIKMAYVLEHNIHYVKLKRKWLFKTKTKEVEDKDKYCLLLSTQILEITNFLAKYNL